MEPGGLLKVNSMNLCPFSYTKVPKEIINFLFLLRRKIIYSLLSIDFEIPLTSISFLF